MGKRKLANRSEGLRFEVSQAVEAIGAGNYGVHEAGMGAA